MSNRDKGIKNFLPEGFELEEVELEELEVNQEQEIDKVTKMVDEVLEEFALSEDEMYTHMDDYNAGLNLLLSNKVIFKEKIRGMLKEIKGVDTQ